MNPYIVFMPLPSGGKHIFTQCTRIPSSVTSMLVQYFGSVLAKVVDMSLIMSLKHFTAQVRIVRTIESLLDITFRS